MNLRYCLIMAMLLGPLPATAVMQAKPVGWSIGKQTFSGFVVYDDASAAKRPGLVMVPNWRGVNASAIDKAKQIAGDDYVVLVADVYGSKVRPTNDTEAGKVAGALREDRAKLRLRIEQAVAVLKQQVSNTPLDPARIGAFGFCFGGTTALELIRGGSQLAGVVSLHGGLSTNTPAKPGSARTPVLVLNGAADKSVTDADIVAFEQEMDAAGADWQLVDFGGAAHCFAEADAGNDPQNNCRYNQRAAKRAYRLLHAFFKERFNTK